MTQQNIFQIFGHITVFFSTLDVFVTGCIIEIASSEYKASNQPLKDTTTLGTKLRILEKFGDDDVISPEVLKTIKESLPEAITVSDERNRFMHDLWKFDPLTLQRGIINRISFTDLKNWNTIPKDEVPYTYADLELLLSRIGTLQCTFADALQNLQSLCGKT